MLIYIQYLTTNNKVIKGTAFYPWITLPKFLITHLPSNSGVGRDNYHRFLLERSGREGSETLLQNSFISSSVVPSLLSLPWHRISHHFKPRPVQTQPCWKATPDSSHFPPLENINISHLKSVAFANTFFLNFIFFFFPFDLAVLYPYFNTEIQDSAVWSMTSNNDKKQP